MRNDTDLTTALERINPVPDPEALGDRSPALWSSLAEHTVRSEPRKRPRYSRRAVLVTVAAVVVLAVPALALVLGAPPLDREFATPQSATLSVYGADQGIPDGCAWRLTFDGAGRPLVGGDCGILEPSDDRWTLVADPAMVGDSLMDLAVDQEGGVWVASPEEPLRRLVGETMTEMQITSPEVGVDPGGTVWAIELPEPVESSESAPTLVRYSEGVWRQIGGTSVDDGESAGAGDITIGSDGTVWVLVGDELARVVGERLEVVDLDLPAYWAPNFLATAPDGAVWIALESGEVVERLGVSDVVTYLVRYDGSASVPLEVPFAEINDLAVDASGTVWASSSVHGVFSNDGAEWTRYGMAEGMPSTEISFLEAAPDGSIYAGTPLGLVDIHTDG